MSSFLSSWSPLASLWQPPSPSCAVWSMHSLLSLLLCLFTTHSVSFRVLSQFPKCRRTHNQHMVLRSYTTPFFLRSDWGFFVRIKDSLRVPFDLKVVLMPRCLHLRSVLSFAPFTWGIGGGTWSWSRPVHPFGWEGMTGIGWFLRVRYTNSLG